MDFKNFLKESASIQKSLRERTTPIVNRWEGTRLLEGLNDTDKHTLAQLLQNQTNQLVTEASRTSTAVGSEEWSDIALPLVRKIFVEQLAKNLVHTQAMNMPTGVVFFLDFVLDENKPSAKAIYNAGESVYGTTNAEASPTGGFYGGDKYSYSMNYYSASVVTNGSGSATYADVEYDANLSASIASGEIFFLDVEKNANWNADYEALETFIVSGAGITDVVREYTKEVDDNLRFYHKGSVVASGTTVQLNYTEQPNEYDRGDYETGQAGVNPISEMNIKVNQKQIVAKTRKLKTEITPELIQDLNAYQSLDAQKEMTNMLSSYIAQEEDSEILSMLSKASRNVTRYWSAVPGRYVNASTGAVSSEQAQYTLGPTDWYKTLGIRIRDVSNEIHKRTLRGGANWMVVSPKVATILESFNTYQMTPESGGGTFGLGVESAGTLDGRIKIYKNPYYRDNEILLGFKGGNFLESGAAYTQYVPLILTPPITDPDTFSVKQGVLTRNGKIVLRNEFYARILIRDLDTV